MKKLFLAILIILILAPIIFADNLTNDVIVLSKTEIENSTTNLNSEGTAVSSFEESSLGENQIKVGIYI